MLHYLLPVLFFASVVLFWRIPVLLFFLLTVIAIWAIREKKELWLFIIFGLFAAIADLVISRAGAWSYTIWHLDGVPYWLPLAYGLLAIVVLRLYRAIEEYEEEEKNTKKRK